MKKRIVLCADDYGQAPAISQGILALIQQQRLTATSCLVTFPHWKEHAAWLLPYQSQLDIGLHFNLTEGQALSSAFKKAYGAEFPRLAKLIMQSSLRRLNPDVIAAELTAQIEAFEKELGFLPRFLDGHQHVHQFSGIRQAVLNVYEKHLRVANSYVRLVNIPMHGKHLLQIKKMVIQMLGGNKLQSLLNKQAIPHNTSFAGIYDFSVTPPYATRFLDFLREIKDGGMIMCHPGLSANSGKDAIEQARYQEYLYFAGPQFLADCEAAEVELSRYR